MPINAIPMEDKGAFCINEDALRAIFSSITKFTGNNCTVSVEFDDRFEHSTDDIEEFLLNRYLALNIVKDVDFHSSSQLMDKDKKYIRLNFQSRGSEARVNVRISSSNDDLNTIRTEIKREIKSCRTKYYALYRISGFYAGMLFIGLGWYFGISV